MPALRNQRVGGRIVWPLRCRRISRFILSHRIASPQENRRRLQTKPCIHLPPLHGGLSIQTLLAAFPLLVLIIQKPSRPIQSVIIRMFLISLKIFVEYFIRGVLSLQMPAPTLSETSLVLSTPLFCRSRMSLVSLSRLQTSLSH